MLKNALLLGYSAAQMTIEANLAGIGQQDSLEASGEAGNCINWLAGHLLWTRDSLLKELAGKSPLLSADESLPYARGSSGLAADAEALPIERIREGLRQRSADLQQLLASLDESALARPLPPEVFPIPVKEPTLGNLLTFLLFHEAYHSGQLGLARRCLGQPSGLGI